MIKAILNRMTLILANKNWDTKRAYLIAQGAKMGRGTRLNCDVRAFGTEPYLITVGEDCLFASDIHLITHDGGIKVINSLGLLPDRFPNKRADKIAPITIGNNVYIGTGAYIMPGVHIGDNSIIGAGAIVTRDIEANSVAVGIPAKVIESIDDYLQHTLQKNSLFPTAGMSRQQKRDYFTHMADTERSSME